VNGQPMLLQLGIGFDGQLIWRTPRAVKRALGFLGVTASAFRTGITFDYPEVRVRGSLADGGTLDVVVTSAMIANAKRWAGPQLAVPTADPSDDVIDVLLVDYRNFGQLARFWFGILFPGSPHLRLPYVRHARMTRVRVDAVGRAVEAHVDGEPSVMTPITVEPLRRVDLLAPATRS
jgi:diacylglycerol kinase family enzyme